MSGPGHLKVPFFFTLSLLVTYFQELEFVVSDSLGCQ
jgi:hypothetical protein